MLKNFENKFGSKENVLVVMGDYDKGSNNMKGKEPTICKKFRRLFKNKGYEMYLINEFRTSIRCNECLEELEKFKMNPSKKPYNKGELCLCNGLLRCQSVKHKSEIFRIFFSKICGFSRVSFADIIENNFIFNNSIRMQFKTC